MSKFTFTGKTIDQAIAAGLLELNVKESQIKVQVVEQPTKGFLGLIGAKDAKVEIELFESGVSKGLSFLQDVLVSMNSDVKVEQVSTADHTVFNLVGRNLGILIGKRGQTLDSLQYLVNIVSNRNATNRQRIVLDAENFRDRRRATLEQLSLRIASRVSNTRLEVMLEPMPPQERKIIHERLQDHPKVRTFSQGDEPNRRIVIAYRTAH